MKQTRIIRISFLIAAVFIVASFWAGFYFGENNTQPDNILVASEDGENAASGQKTEREADVSQKAENVQQEEEEPEETVESMKDVEEERYYLKLADDYLAVYHSDTDQIYFETGLKLTDLPEDLQEKAEEGISFSSLEELYSFLENYSS